MHAIQVDWAGDVAPDVGVWSGEGDDVIVVVQHDARPGPSGHPTTLVVALAAHAGVPAHREAMALDAWVRAEYDATLDDDGVDELIDAATLA